MFMSHLIYLFLCIACPYILPISYWIFGVFSLLDLKVYLKYILERLLVFYLCYIANISPSFFSLCVWWIVGFAI